MVVERDENRGRGQAEAQLQGIRQMVDRLEHANDCDGDPETCDLEDIDMLSGMDIWPHEREATEEERERYHDANEAMDAISEDPLSVEVRSDWFTPGEEAEPGEFRILLCTGGPAVQIRGEIGPYGQPDRAWLEFQDWFTPWTELITTGADHDALLTYARQFLGY